jgi:hypothetical protein
MNKSPFENNCDLDIEFLEVNYAEDLHKAAMVFEEYLKELPDHISDLNESLESHNIYKFRELLQKLKQRFTQVGLSQVAGRFQDFYFNCRHAQDLILYKIEIQQVVNKIESATPAIRNILLKLQKS